LWNRRINMGKLKLIKSEKRPPAEKLLSEMNEKELFYDGAGGLCCKIARNGERWNAWSFYEMGLVEFTNEALCFTLADGELRHWRQEP
jgi:hypothetical protein